MATYNENITITLGGNLFTVTPRKNINQSIDQNLSTGYTASFELIQNEYLDFNVGLGSFFVPTQYGDGQIDAQFDYSLSVDWVFAQSETYDLNQGYSVYEYELQRWTWQNVSTWATIQTTWGDNPVHAQAVFNLDQGFEALGEVQVTSIDESITQALNTGYDVTEENVIDVAVTYDLDAGYTQSEILESNYELFFSQFLDIEEANEAEYAAVIAQGLDQGYSTEVANTTNTSVLADLDLGSDLAEIVTFPNSVSFNIVQGYSESNIATYYDSVSYNVDTGYTSEGIAGKLDFGDFDLDVGYTLSSVANYVNSVTYSFGAGFTTDPGVVIDTSVSFGIETDTAAEEDLTDQDYFAQFDLNAGYSALGITVYNDAITAGIQTGTTATQEAGAFNEIVTFDLDTGYTADEDLLGQSVSAQYNLDTGFNVSTIATHLLTADFGITVDQDSSIASGADESIESGITVSSAVSGSVAFDEDVVIDLLSGYDVGTSANGTVSFDLSQGFAATAENVIDVDVAYGTLHRMRYLSGQLELKWIQSTDPITWQNIQVYWNTPPKEEFPYVNLDVSFSQEEFLFSTAPFYNVLGYTASSNVVPLWYNSEGNPTNWDDYEQGESIWASTGSPTGVWTDVDETSSVWSNTNQPGGVWGEKLYTD